MATKPRSTPKTSAELKKALEASKKRTAMLSVLNGQSWTKSQEHSIAEHLSPFSGFASQAFARRGKLPYFFKKTRRLTTRADKVSA